MPDDTAEASPTDIALLVSALTVMDCSIATAFESRDLLFPTRFRKGATGAWETERFRFGDLIAAIHRRANSPEFRRLLAREGLYGDSLRLKYSYLVWAFDTATLRIGEELVNFSDLLGLRESEGGLWIRSQESDFRALWRRFSPRMRWPTRARVRQLLAEVLAHGEPILDSALQCIPGVGGAAVELKDLTRGLLNGRSRERPARELAPRSSQHGGA